VEQLVQKGILLRVPPQRNEGEIVLARCLLVLLEDDVVDVELVHVLEQPGVLRREGVGELREGGSTMAATEPMVTSSSSSKKAACSTIMFQICSSLLKESESGVMRRSGLMRTPVRCSWS
jgi:hypothetical protein